MSHFSTVGLDLNKATGTEVGQRCVKGIAGETTHKQNDKIKMADQGSKRESANKDAIVTGSAG